MPADRPLFAGLFEGFRWGERDQKGSVLYVIPSSDHVAPYYTPEFFVALNPQVAPELTTAALALMGRVHSADVALHSDTNAPTRVATPVGEVRVTTTGAETIARDYLMDLINPEMARDRNEVKRTILITTIDQLLASYFANRHLLTSVEFGRQRFIQDGSLQTIRGQLAGLESGSKFRINARGRSAEVRVLPLPSPEHFMMPRYCLIGPQESDFRATVEASRVDSKRIVFEAKRNQAELGVAHLIQFNPRRIFITESGYPQHRLMEGGQVRTINEIPQPGQGLEFVVVTRKGNVDGFVRRTKDSSTPQGILGRFRRNSIAGVFGMDVVQTGSGNRANRLKVEDEILPIPCYPVEIKIVLT